MNKRIAAELIMMGACGEAVAWAAQQKSRAAAWKTCGRGDWMLWYLGTRSGPPESDARRRLVLCACECVRLALPYVKAGETRPLKAIETAEGWARNDGTTLAQVRAAYAAYAAYAANAAYATYAAYAANAAYAYAAAYATYAAYAANAAYAAANAAANAAYAAAAADAKTKTLAQCADIVRRHYSRPPSRTARSN